MLEQAQTRYFAFKDLKSHIFAKTKQLQEVVAELRQTVKENSSPDHQQVLEGNDKSLLTQRQDDYLRFVEIRQTFLEALLLKDELHWASNLRDCKKSAT